MDNQKVKVSGEITAKFYDQSSLNFWKRLNNKTIRILKNKFPELMKFYQLGKLSSIDEHHNVICNNGFNAICRRLANDTTYTGIINKCLLGTGAGTASASDTQLITEAYRNDVGSATASSNVAYVTAYYTEVECSGTYTEFGNVIDGTASANTGRLWSHLAGLSWVKNGTTVLVVDCKYTFASV